MDPGRSADFWPDDRDTAAVRRKSDAFAMLGANIEAFRIRKHNPIAMREDKPVVIKLKGQAAHFDGEIGATMQHSQAVLLRI